MCPSEPPDRPRGPGPGTGFPEVLDQGRGGLFHLQPHQFRLSALFSQFQAGTSDVCPVQLFCPSGHLPPPSSPPRPVTPPPSSLSRGQRRETLGGVMRFFSSLDASLLSFTDFSSFSSFMFFYIPAALVENRVCVTGKCFLSVLAQREEVRRKVPVTKIKAAPSSAASV